jgi:hypothetical protein
MTPMHPLGFSNFFVTTSFFAFAKHATTGIFGCHTIALAVLTNSYKKAT